ncbi:MAG: hypothetical protein OEL76_15330 [Siculibacillus sp.]|nr:hypothetical protein [Siculibacillus sp.]
MTPSAPSFPFPRFLSGLALLVALPTTAVAQQGAPAAAPVSTAPVAAAPALRKPALDRHGMPEKLTGERIRETWFDGRPFTAVGPDGTVYRMVFTPDGKAARVPLAAKKPKPTAGFWRVIAEGYCSRWTGSNREKCFNVRPSEDGSETLVRFGQQMAAKWQRP